MFAVRVGLLVLAECVKMIFYLEKWRALLVLGGCSLILGKFLTGIFGLLLVGLFVSPASAGGREEFNGCRGTTSDPCIRSGYCSIQQSD